MRAIPTNSVPVSDNSIVAARGVWPDTASVCSKANAARPELLNAAERLDEIAEILAAGLTRLRARQSTPLPADLGENSLDCTL